MAKNKVIFWHRRDLRIEDNHGLFEANLQFDEVIPIFIFDDQILNQLAPDDARVTFIYQQITILKKAYQSVGSDLHVYYGNPLILLPQLVEKFQVQGLFFNKDYEPYARKRDGELFKYFSNSIQFQGFKDHVIFEKKEIVKADGTPYLVFTPYSKKWKEVYHQTEHKPFSISTHHFIQLDPIPMLSYPDIQMVLNTQITFPESLIAEEIITHYDQKRNFPAIKGTSRLGLHLRFGTISIRNLVAYASITNEVFLNELIWREFYQMLIYFFPHTAHQAFKPKFDAIPWKNDEHDFKLWCEGRTGYPIVDAGMRELNQTGFMHNRVRMIVASFLTKHLLIDWRWGEAYFAQKLLDYEQASNIGGWQWAAGCGCDAAPYFRVFNPTAQQEKFDPKFEYTKKWIPELGTKDYPEPIVEHKFARDRYLSLFKN